jgi:hypothetical protein
VTSGIEHGSRTVLLMFFAPLTELPTELIHERFVCDEFIYADRDFAEPRWAISAEILCSTIKVCGVNFRTNYVPHLVAALHSL